MEELLQKLMDAEVLSEDTRVELKEAFDSQLKEAIAAAEEKAAAEARADLTEQWVEERDNLIEAIDTKVSEFLEDELNELKEDIDRFRDLEAEYAEKLVEAKGNMSEELKTDLKELVEKIDAFLEIRLAAEIDELREDIDEVRKNEFGRKLYEAFAEEFTSTYADDESAQTSLRETEERLAEATQALEESEKARAELERTKKMNEVLSPLNGRSKEVMEAILRNVDTENLEQGYSTFIGRVLRETSDDDASSEKEDKVLAESEKEDSDSEIVKETVTVNGDSEDDLITETEQMEGKLTAEARARLQRLGGIA